MRHGRVSVTDRAALPLNTEGVTTQNPGGWEWPELKVSESTCPVCQRGECWFHDALKSFRREWTAAHIAEQKADQATEGLLKHALDERDKALTENKELRKAVIRARKCLEMIRDDDAEDGKPWAGYDAASLIINHLYEVSSK